MIRLRLTYFIIILGAVITISAIPVYVNAQDVPQKTEVPKPPKRKRIKQKKLKGDQARSNRKQLRQTKFKTRNRQGDKATKGDITGRKFQSRKTRRNTTPWPQPDPYAGRRPRDMRVDKAGPEPPPDFREPPKGERARSGDITGKRRIRTRSASSARSTTYARQDPYAGREQRSAERAQRIRRAQVAGSRTASRTAERKSTVAATRPKSVSGLARIRSAKNPYAGKEQRRGETATTKDIAGRKLRTRNTNSAPRIPGGGYAPTDTYYGRKTGPEGGRFSRGAMAQGRAPSISRSGEERGRAYKEPELKNYQSPRPKTTGPMFDPYAGRKEVGEGGRFKDRGKPGIRSATQSAERKMQFQAVVPKSVSGIRKIRKSKDPYAGRERRPGEQATNRDIAGRKLRTRGFESPRPQWGQTLRSPDTYYGRKDRGDQISKARIPSQGAGSISGGIWNNKGLPIGSKPPSAATQQATQFRGRFRSFDLQPGYGDDRAIGKYQGRFKQFELQGGYNNDRAISKYQGRFRPYELNPGYSNDKAIGKYQGTFKRYELQPGYSNQRAIGKYQGRFKSYELQPGYSDQRAIGKYQGRFKQFELQGGYNNDRAIAKYQGRFRPYELQPGYSDQKAIGKYQGRFRQFELQGGYNNDRAIAKYKGRFRPYELQPGYSDQKAIGKYQGRFRPFELQGGFNNDRAIAKYKGRFRPYELQPGYSDQKAIGKYQGRFKEFELQGGYNSDRAISRYKGSFKPYELQPGYYDDRRVARYQGNIKAGKPLKGGGSISGELWNNREQPLAKKYGPSSGTQFQGNLKTRGALKGAGGSISGELWNNREQPLAKKYGPSNGTQFQGNLKTKGALKGAGGSISGELWNNREQPLAKKYGPSTGTQFQGNLKTKGAMKGAGGSISGELWNNNDQPLAKSTGASEGTQYGQSRKFFFMSPSGNTRESTEVTTANKNSGMNYGQSRKFFFMSPSGNTRESSVVTSAVKKSETNFGQVRSLFFITPAKAKEYKGYVSRDPEFFELFSSRKQMHPSHAYTQDEPKNSKDEKEKVFKFKIWWAQLFGANGNQPQNLKEREKKPRYDKRESGIWYE